MATPSNFPGANLIFKGDGDVVQDLPTFSNGRSVVSVWHPSEDEWTEMRRTGVYLSIQCGDRFYPAFVGSESTCRDVVLGTGPVWSKDAAG